MTLQMKDVFLDGRRMGAVSSWAMVVELLKSSGHRDVAEAVRLQNTRVATSAEGRDGFHIRRAKGAAA